jgi:ubiquinone/menaquinone biosynthesis C-methylase UbiE
MPNWKADLSLADWHQRYCQQAEWTAEIRRHLFGKAGLEDSDRLLEVGCGTGAVLGSIAEEIDLEFFGVDIDRASLDFAHKENPDFNLTQADGHLLPFADGLFDAIFCHYLLLWVASPARVLAEMKRVTRPGGAVIALAEPDHTARIDFPPPLDELGRLQTAALTAQGADVSLGKRLRDLFTQTGLVKSTTGILGAQWGPSTEQISGEWDVLRSDLNHSLSEDELNAFEAVDRQAWASGERVMFIPTFYAIGWVERK